MFPRPPVSHRLALLAGLIGLVAPPDLLAADAHRLVGIRIEPEKAILSGARARQQLLVTGCYADGRDRDLTRRCRFESSDPGIATVSATGIVQPAANGAATITVRFEGYTSSAAIQVAQHQDRSYRFEHDVLPVISQLGCNQMGCHGSPKGKKELRLSLFGTEPDVDFTALTRTGKNALIDVKNPQASLLLRKAVGDARHGGGARTVVDSPGYRVLRDWIAAGAPRGATGGAKLSSLTVFPRERLLDASATQALLVEATFSDGSRRDVTALAGFTSSDEQIATVTAEGMVQACGLGEAVIIVSFADRTTTSRLIIPRSHSTPFPRMVVNNRIDELMMVKWRKLNLIPSDLSSDTEFLRRVHLDVLGVLPTPAEVRAFLADPRIDKRDRLIDALLARPEFVDMWTLKWCDLLRVNRGFPVNLREKGMQAYYGWVRDSVAKNKPMDQFVRELLTAQGSGFEVGPANFYRVTKDAQGMAEQAAALFLGVRLECAHCHSHPFEPITWDDNYGLAAFFSRVKLRRTKTRDEEVVFLADRGVVRHAGTGKPVAPRVLGGQALDLGKGDPREKLAGWITSPDNPYFARNLANRVWFWLMGRGIVHEPDDFRASNPPSHPELLDHLAGELVRARYDIKVLFRQVLRSRTYQLRSKANATNEQDTVHFARYRVKRLSAEQLLDAICQATEAPERFPGMETGTRAMQLPDGGVRSPFLDVFGRPRRAQGCECERSSEMHVGQSLTLISSDTVESKLAAPKGRIARLLSEGKSNAEIVEELYLATLSRSPTARERQMALGFFKEGQRRQKAQDLLWALMNTKEFLFNH